MDISTVNILIGGLIALISTVVTLAVSSRRDMNTERRRVKAEHQTLMRDIYTEAIGYLIQLIIVVESLELKPDLQYFNSYMERGIKIRAQLRLISTEEIIEQFRKVTNAGNELIQMIGQKQEQKDKTLSLSAIEIAFNHYREEFTSLSEQMRQHLTGLEEERLK